MAYRDFTLEKIRNTFGIQFETKKIFDNIISLEPSDWLKETLERSKLFSLTTEKIRSEAVVFPILSEVKGKNVDSIQLFSGEVLNADKEMKLMGECDYIFSKNRGIPRLIAPLISVIEAKKSDIDIGIDQCSAQMVGILKFNETHNETVPIIYGCVTNSQEWRFLRFQNNTITIDSDTYFIKELNTILGIFQFIVDSYR